MFWRASILQVSSCGVFGSLGLPAVRPELGLVFVLTTFVTSIDRLVKR